MIPTGLNHGHDKGPGILPRSGPADDIITTSGSGYDYRKFPSKETLNFSEFHSSWAPGVLYTYIYNHARRLRLGKIL